MEIGLNKIITKADGRKYWITNKTVQNNRNFFFALVLDDNNEPTVESHIFELINYDNSDYLEDVKDQNLCDSLAGIFINESYKDGMKETSEN